MEDTRIKGSTATCNDPNMTPHASLYKGGHHGTLSNSYEILNTVEDDAANVVLGDIAPQFGLQKYRTYGYRTVRGVRDYVIRLPNASYVGVTGLPNAS